MKKGEAFIVLVVFMLFAGIGLVSAAELNLKITGTINDYNSDIYLRTSSSSSNSLDMYDMKVPSCPDNYSQFYSDITTDQLSIDSWNADDNPRTLNLVYYISEAQTGELALSWNSLSGSDYEATLSDYGNESGGTVVGSANMRTESSYSTTLSEEQNNYFKITVSDYVAPTVITTAITPSAGGGGGAAPARAVISGLAFDIKNINLDLVLNSYKERLIKVTNLGTEERTVFLDHENLNDLVMFEENSFKLGPGESKEIKITFLASKKAGVYAGKLYIGGYEILTSINVRTKELLFDAMISVPDYDKIIRFGDKLDTQITLIPMGEDPRVDVTLHYLIKDFEGKTFFEESETMLVDQQRDFGKTFHTKNFPVGNYIVGLEVVYPNGVASSSSHFQVVKKTPFDVRIILISLIVGIGILIILVIILIIRHKKKRKKFLFKLRKK